MKHLKVSSLIACVLGSTVAHAQFSGTSFFSVQPFTNAPGAVSNFLSVTDTANGFTVSGTWSINMPANTSNGFLLAFQVKRPMQFAAFNNWTTTTSIPGTDFINRPVGNSMTGGGASTSVDSGPGSTSGWTFTNPTGSGTYFYNGGFGYTNTSTAFNYAGGNGQYMTLDYFLDLDYSGNGGFYAFTFPLTAELNPVPEPVTLLGVGACLAAFFRKKRRA